MRLLRRTQKNSQWIERAFQKANAGCARKIGQNSCNARRQTYGTVDIVAFLGKGSSGWKVLNLQARADAGELAPLRASPPANYPLSIVNKFYGDLLLGV
jgi:hypothetical protein